MLAADSQTRVLFLLSSERRNGNTELLARRAADILPVTAEQSWLRHMDHRLPPFADVRHDVSYGGKYPPPEGNAKILLEATIAATDIVFVSPVYWYGLPAEAKLYLDHWSAWMRVDALDFKDRMRGKRVRTVTMLSDDDKSLADPLINTLRLTAEYLGMHWCGALVGYGNRPGDARLQAFVSEDYQRFWENDSR